MLDGDNIKNRYRANVLFRVVLSLLIPFFVFFFTLFSEQKSLLLALTMPFAAFFLYSLFSIQIHTLDDDIRLFLTFPKKIVLKRIRYNLNRWR